MVIRTLKVIKFWIVLSLLFAVLAGCGEPKEANGQKELEAEPETASIFDARKVEVGSKVANMTMVEKDVSEDGEVYFAVVKFSGEATVTGTLSFFEESQEGWGFGNSFSPDNISGNQIPSLDINPTRNGFTLIDNENQSLEQLKKSGNRFEVEMIIKDYEIYETGKGQENVATLIEIVKSEKLE